MSCFAFLLLLYYC